MPNRKKHVDSCLKKFGYHFEGLHSWMDEKSQTDEVDHRQYRHDQYKTPDEAFKEFENKVPPSQKGNIMDAVMDHLRLDGVVEGEAGLEEQGRINESLFTDFEGVDLDSVEKTCYHIIRLISEYGGYVNVGGDTLVANQAKIMIKMLLLKLIESEKNTQPLEAVYREYYEPPRNPYHPVDKSRCINLIYQFMEKRKGVSINRPQPLVHIGDLFPFNVMRNRFEWYIRLVMRKRLEEFCEELNIDKDEEKLKKTMEAIDDYRVGENVPLVLELFEKGMVGRVYMFSLPLELKQDLQQMQVSERLREIFKQHGYPLSEQPKIYSVEGKERKIPQPAEILLITDKEWVILDGTKEYIIKEGDKQLNVYWGIGDSLVEEIRSMEQQMGVGVADQS